MKSVHMRARRPVRMGSMRGITARRMRTRRSTARSGTSGPANRLTTLREMTNIANQDSQPQVFGDVRRRHVIGELRVQF